MSALSIHIDPRTAAVARQWHAAQRLAIKAVADCDEHVEIGDEDDDPMSHEDMAARMLDELSTRLGDEAIGLDVYTVCGDERHAVRWTVRWWDEMRDPCGRKLPWIAEGPMVAWDAAKGCPR